MGDERYNFHLKIFLVTTNFQLHDFPTETDYIFLYGVEGTDFFTFFVKKISPQFWKQKNKISPLTSLVKLS